jgi:hypothetical protein
MWVWNLHLKRDKEIFPYRDALLSPVHVRTADSRSVSADDFPDLPCTLAGSIDHICFSKFIEKKLYYKDTLHKARGISSSQNSLNI